jgi:hypothetical protein
VLEGLGGVWPSSSMYDKLRYMGPWYRAKGAVELSAKHTRALVEYEHVVKLQTLVPQDQLLPSLLDSHVTPTFEMGSIAAPGFVPDGTILDTEEGVVVLPPTSLRKLCQDIRRRAPTMPICAMALPVSVVVATSGVRVSAAVDFWVQVLEQKASQLNPLPRLVAQEAGPLGEALYSSAADSLPLECGQTKEVKMRLENLPSLTALDVSEMHPSDTSRAKAVDQPDAVFTSPVALIHPVPSAWHSSDAWDPAHVAVSGTDVTVTLAPKCGREGSRGLQTVCLQFIYMLDDECAPPPADDCNPSNFGCMLENPNTRGRCYVTSAPSRCIFYTVTNPAQTARPRHTAAPPPEATPAPTPPPPPPAQPTIQGVEDPVVPQTHVHHVLDFASTLEDQQRQMHRCPALACAWMLRKLVLIRTRDANFWGGRSVRGA